MNTSPHIPPLSVAPMMDRTDRHYRYFLRQISRRTLLYTEDYPDAWWKFAGCGLLGLTNAMVFLQLAQYYTDYLYSPVRLIAHASTTGHGTNIIAGVAVGMESTGIAACCIGASIIGAYHIGQDAMPGGGLYGTSVATMGMLSSAVYVLAMDTFGAGRRHAHPPRIAPPPVRPAPAPHRILDAPWQGRSPTTLVASWR